MSSNQALVFGASGIGGWAILRECILSDDTKHAFEQVIGLTNKPMSMKDLLLDAEHVDTDRIYLYSGINLRSDPAAVEAALRKIPDIERTTHVFYSAYGGHLEAYSSNDPFTTLATINTHMLSSALDAVLHLCPQLKIWTLQSGAKAYGIEILACLGSQGDASPPSLNGLRYRTPLRESDLPVKPPHDSKIFYNAQHELLVARSRGQAWKFYEVMPGIITGHTPRLQVQNFGHLLSLWLSLHIHINGTGTDVAFPGSEAVYKARWSDTSQDTLASFAIHLALNAPAASGERFNIADEDECATWECVWPEICSYFGLSGRPPAAGSNILGGANWVQANKSHWSTFEKKNNIPDNTIEKSSWGFLDIILCSATFDREYDMGKTRQIGYLRSSRVFDGYIAAFQKMKKAGVLP